MRFAGDHSTGLLLIEILGEVAADLCDRALHVRPPDHHGEVANVGLVLLLEMDVQAILGDPTGRELRPRPMNLALHDREQCFAELVGFH